jgi:hypothetical protein
MRSRTPPDYFPVVNGAADAGYRTPPSVPAIKAKALFGFEKNGWRESRSGLSR